MPPSAPPCTSPPDTAGRVAESTYLTPISDWLSHHLAGDPHRWMLLLELADDFDGTVAAAAELTARMTV